MSLFTSRIVRLTRQLFNNPEQNLPAEVIKVIEDAVVPALADSETKVLFGTTNKENIGKHAVYNYGDSNHFHLCDGYGAVASFDGVNDQLTFNDITLEHFDSTLCFWVRVFPGTTDPFIFGNTSTTDYIRFVGNSIVLQAGGSTGSRAINVNIPKMNLNTWRHVTIARDNEDIICYINGKFVDRIVNWNGTNALVINAIGRDNLGSTFFNGLMQDVIFYDRLLSASEIEVLFNCGKEPIEPDRYYKMNESLYTSGLLVDSGNDGLDATITGCLPAAGRLKHVNSDTNHIALSDDLVWTDWEKRSFTVRSNITFPNLGTNLSLDGASSITKSFWYMHDSNNTGTYALWDVNKDGINDFGWGIDNGALVFYYNFNNLGSGTIQLTSGAFISTFRKWTHAVATFDGDLLSLYLNGELVTTVSAPTDTIIHNFNSRFNARITSGGQSAELALHDARIYSDAISADNVERLYKGEKDISNDTLIWHVPFNQTDYSSGAIDIISANNGTINGTSTTIHRMAPKIQNFFIPNGFHLNGAEFLLSSIEDMFDDTLNSLENFTIGYAVVSKLTRAFEGITSIFDQEMNDYFYILGGPFSAGVRVSYTYYNYTYNYTGLGLNPSIDPFETNPLFYTAIINFRNRQIDKIYINGIDESVNNYTYQYSTPQELSSDVISIGVNANYYNPLGNFTFMGDVKYYFITQKEFNDADAIYVHNYLSSRQ